MGVRFSIVSVYKTIQYWNIEHGAGVNAQGIEDRRHWGADADYLKGVVKEYHVMEELRENIEKDLKEYLSDNLHTNVDYLIMMDDGRIDTNFIEDDDAVILNDKDEKYHHENQIPMFLCDYSFEVEIQNVYEPKLDELKELFPNCEHS